MRIAKHHTVALEEEHHTALRETVRTFATKEVAPVAARIDLNDEFPADLYRRMGELGLLGLTTPVHLGGQGADNVAMTIAIEELARASGTVANACLLAKLQSDVICRLGTQEQTARHVPAIASGASICLIAATEPDAGSDVAAITTTARREPDGWRINGSKAYMTAGAVGDLAVVLARTSDDDRDGLSLFLCPKAKGDDPTTGFVTLTKESLMGMRGLATAGLVFDGTLLPEDAMLGMEGKGLSGVLGSFTNGRIMIASLALGLAAGAFDASVRYARTRQSFGRRIGDHQMVQSMIADAHVGIETARLLIQQAAKLKDAGHDYSQAASMAKLYASDVANRVASDAVQIHGGFGYSQEAGIERIFRDAKLTQIYEGTNEIQRVIIARSLIGAA